MMIEQRQGSCDMNFQNALLVTYHSLAESQSRGEGWSLIILIYPVK
jgi:hypothetical protein